MRQKHHRDRPSSYLSARYCAGAVLHRAIGSAIALHFAAGTALADVCDKVVGEHWHPSDGPAWLAYTAELSGMSLAVPLVLFGIPAVIVGEQIGLKVLASARASIIAAVYLKWLAYVVTGLIAAVAFFTLWDFIAGDGIMRAAAHEGCISLKTNVLACAAVALVVGFYGWTAWRMRRFEQEAETRYRSLAV